MQRNVEYLDGSNEGCLIENDIIQEEDRLNVENTMKNKNRENMRTKTKKEKRSFTQKDFF